METTEKSQLNFDEIIAFTLRKTHGNEATLLGLRGKQGTINSDPLSISNTTTVGVCHVGVCWWEKLDV